MSEKRALDRLVSNDSLPECCVLFISACAARIHTVKRKILENPRCQSVLKNKDYDLLEAFDVHTFERAFELSAAVICAPLSTIRQMGITEFERVVSRARDAMAVSKLTSIPYKGSDAFKAQFVSKLCLQYKVIGDALLKRITDWVLKTSGDARLLCDAKGKKMALATLDLGSLYVDWMDMLTNLMKLPEAGISDTDELEMISKRLSDFKAKKPRIYTAMIFCIADSFVRKKNALFTMKDLLSGTKFVRYDCITVNAPDTRVCTEALDALELICLDCRCKYFNAEGGIIPQKGENICPI